MHEFVISYTDLALAYVKAIEGKNLELKRPANQTRLLELIHQEWDNERFSGATKRQMSGWIANGYTIEGLQMKPELAPVRKRRKMFLNDMDGEFQFDMWNSGEDLYFLDFTPRETVPGVNYEIMVGFASSTPVETVQEYTSWVLKSLIALDASGIDCQISVSGIWEKQRPAKENEKIYWRVIVKNAGEKLDIASWSAILSPGGFRHLCFLAYLLASDANGIDCPYNMGYSLETRNFQVSLNHERKAIVAQPKRTCDKYAFGEESMTEQFRNAIVQARESGM